MLVFRRTGALSLWRRGESTEKAGCQAFSPDVGIGTPPTTQPLTRWQERGWESPNSDEGTYTVVLCIYCTGCERYGRLFFEVYKNYCRKSLENDSIMKLCIFIP
jgi:hypothetical protein